MFKNVRTRWALLALLAIALLVVAGCGRSAGPAPEAARAGRRGCAWKKLRLPKKLRLLEEVAPAEEAAPAAVVADPIPYPDPPDLGLGDLDPVRRPIDQIVTYKALPEYNEPEWVTELVEAGELPPLEERLPAEPMVWLEAAMEDGIGVYGDGHHALSACPTARVECHGRRQPGLVRH